MPATPIGDHKLSIERRNVVETERDHHDRAAHQDDPFECQSGANGENFAAWLRATGNGAHPLEEGIILGRVGPGDDIKHGKR